MNFDIAVYGDDEKGNGAFNQNVLNVEAVGTASTDGDGNLTIDSLGSFPVSVNGVDKATTDFRLRLQAPAGAPGEDSTGPTIVAQYPSACAYTFGVGYDDTINYYITGSSALVLDENGDPIPGGEPEPEDATDLRPFRQRNPELDVAVSASEADCAAGTGDGAYPVRAAPEVIEQFGVPGLNSFLPSESLSVTFSEPVDPASLRDVNGNADAGRLQLSGPSGNVPFNVRAQGSSVTVDPAQQLDYNAEYTLTVGTEVTDNAGNPLTEGRQIEFTTASYVPATDDSDALDTNYANVAQTAPFLTTLYPGLPCALAPDSGDFRMGGDTAGYCAGSDQSSSAPRRAWPVFDLPANRSIHTVFSKPVRQDSVTLADGCLTQTNGNAPVATGGTVAVQRMDGSGNCTDIVAGDVVYPHPGGAFARKLRFRPDTPWQDGQRYWLVVCSTDSSVCTADQTIVDKDHGNPATTAEVNAGFPTHDGRLNTTPSISTGTPYDDITECQGFNCTTIARGYGLLPAAGGPDLIMPFDGAPASQDQFLISELMPFTDINGNGFGDGAHFLNQNPFTGEISETNPGAGVLPPNERERIQQANEVRVNVLSLGDDIFAGRAQRSTFQSGAQPVAVQAVTENCPVSDAVRDMIGGTPARCAPVTIYPGGLIAQTAVFVAKTVYGRSLLHTAGTPPPDDPQRTVPQTGYIVDRCQGSYRINAMANYDSAGSGTPAERLTVVGGQPHEYDYSPCFVVSQDLIFTGDPIEGSSAAQQGLTANLVGPVSFERNGRLVIRATNTNNIIVSELFLGGSVQQPTFIAPGQVALQLVGPSIHGGPLEAFKTQ